MPLETLPFDAAEYLDTPDAIAAFLDEAFSEGDPAAVAHALGVIARAKGMTAVAKDAGITREALYKSLSSDGDPRLSTLLGVTAALGMKLHVAAALPSVPPSSP